MRKGLLQLVFSGAHMQLWADKPRHFDMFEPERQALRLAAAFALASGSKPRTDGRLLSKIADAAVNDYFFRLVITDIKPSVLNDLKKDPDTWEGMLSFADGRLRGKLDGTDKSLAGFTDSMISHLRIPSVDGIDGEAARMLDAADCIAVRMEYRMIESTGIHDYAKMEILDGLERRAEKYRGLPGFDEMFDGEMSSPLFRLVSMVNSLRFQIRWPQVTRTPATSVLCHVFLVSVFYHLSARLASIPSSRRGWSFFAGLFHDLPEAVTKDVITPLKAGVPGLRDRLSAFERREMDRILISPLEERVPVVGVNLRYLFGDDGGRFNEFADRRRGADGKTEILGGFDDLKGAPANSDPIDGSLLKACDMLCAYLEASESVAGGRDNGELVRAMVRISDILCGLRFGDLDFKTIMSDFDGGRP